jgi:CheY-like chemotaxis protein
MRILVAWDNPAEVEVLKRALNSTNSHEVVITTTTEELLAHAREHACDVVLQSLTFPRTVEQGLAAFTCLKEVLPNVPLVLACRPAEMRLLSKFLNRGLEPISGAPTTVKPRLNGVRMVRREEQTLPSLSLALTGG